MASNIEFEVGGIEEKVTESYRYELQTTTEDSYSYNYDVEVDLTCTSQEGDPGVGLWQWVTESHDGQSKTFTSNWLCTYGANHASPPPCPWNAYNTATETCNDDWYVK